MDRKSGKGATIVVNISDTQRIEIRVGLGEKLIGRGSLCDLILPHRSVSRKHARIVGTDAGFFLEDMSRNGTLIEGRPITREMLLKETDITIGPYLLHFSPVRAGNLFEEEAPTKLYTGDNIPFPQRGEEADESAPINEPEELGILGKSSAVALLFDVMSRVAGTNLPVLVTGETGTGKELVARGIHLLSGRRSFPFVAINCSAISSELVESELFGHEKGAFTGAVSRRKGAFELARSGTLFLDEVGDMPPGVQPKLLRALEQSEIRRVGSSTTLKVNTRVIAATNRRIEDEMRENRFRKDLYYRLNSFPIHVPPLGERREDIPLLADHFLSKFNATYGGKIEISKRGVRYLEEYDWPGNVRELRNGIFRAAIMSSDGTIDRPLLEEIFPRDKFSHESNYKYGSPPSTLRKIDLAEREAIVSELERCKWNKTRAAKNLGIAKSTFFEKMKRYNIITP